MTGFWKRLMQRKLVQWSIAYVAAAFALLQGIDIIAQQFGWPDELQRGITLAMVLGFFVMLVLAWYHGERGEQRISGTELLILSAVLAIGGGVLWRFTPAPLPPQAAVAPAAAAPVAVARVSNVSERSIAVLPFVNRSADKDQDYFSDGISEDMLNLLAKVPQLKVISRTSSFSFKGKDKSLPEIAMTLGVAYILEGSVQRAGKTLRISAQLVDARKDQSVWSQSWDRQLDDVFKIQDEIADAVVGQLKLKLLGKTQEIDPDAYATYLQARQLARQGTREGYDQAITLFEQALAIEPEYAPAWGELAITYMNQAGYGLRPVPEGARLARAALDNALAADPDDAIAHAKLGWLETWFTDDLPSAAAQFEQALALDPANAGILGNAAIYAQTLGRMDQAIALGKAAVARDPINASAHYNLGYTYFLARRYDEAVASVRTTLRLSPGRIGAPSNLGIALLQKGEPQAALEAAKSEPEEGFRLIALTIIQNALGQKAQADATLSELVAKHEKDGPYNIAYVFALRGDMDKAFEWLDKAQQYKDPGLAEVAVQPLLESLHNDPRWLPLLRKLGKSPAQLDAIEFKVALPPSTEEDTTP